MAKITPIPNYPAYSVSTDGRVLKGDKEMKQYKDRRGYSAVWLYNGHNNRKYMSVHRLVMLAHSPIDNPDEMTVNHKDGVKSNNDISNLEWMTNRENMQHALRTGLYKTENMGGKKGKSYAINPDLLAQILDVYTNTKISIRKLAGLYGVNRATLQYQVNNILTIERNIL